MYEEEPVKALADYYMGAQWDLQILKEKQSYSALIEVNGQQTFMIIKAEVTGNPDKITLRYLETKDGSGTGKLKKGDKLFSLLNTKDSVVTHWEKLSPVLGEGKISDHECFIKK